MRSGFAVRSERSTTSSVKCTQCCRGSARFMRSSFDMDKEERKRLERRGKDAVAANSERVAAVLREANPAPVGSDAWAQNYRRGVELEREARATRDRVISVEEASRKF